jgi:hypothetical protein
MEAALMDSIQEHALTDAEAQELKPKHAAQRVMHAETGAIASMGSRKELAMMQTDAARIILNIWHVAQLIGHVLTSETA